MEHRIVKNDEGVSPVIAVILMVAITVVLAAVLYVWAASFLDQGENAPMAVFFVQEDSSGVYHVDVTKVTRSEELVGFSFYLMDGSGTTYVGGDALGHGEIAMQNITGDLHGIDQNYGGNEAELQERVQTVKDDDGSNFPVKFSDNDRDGKLSAGDRFHVYGSKGGSNGPAEDGWKLEVKYDPSGDTIGSAPLR